MKLKVVTFGLGFWIEKGDEISVREFIDGNFEDSYNGKEYVLNISFLWWTWGFKFVL